MVAGRRPITLGAGSAAGQLVAVAGSVSTSFGSKPVTASTGRQVADTSGSVTGASWVG